MKVAEEKFAFLDDEKSEETTRTSESDSEAPAACHACGSDVDRNAKFCPTCGAKQRRREASPLANQKAIGCCCGCCLCTLIVGVVAIVCLVLSLNSFIKFAVESVGSTLMGVPVTLDSVNFSVMQGRISLNDLDVASPQGYTDDLFQLGRFVFDVSPMSLLWGYMSTFSKPVELEEATIQNIDIWIEMQTLPTPGSNAQVVVHTMNEQVARIAKVAPSLTTPMPTLSPGDTIKVGTAKVKADRVELSNITAAVTLQPLAPIAYTLQRVLVKDVGKKSDGVYLYEFIEILVRALLMSVIKAAPANIQSNLAKGFGVDLWRELDFDGMDLDMGHGFEKMGEFSGWVTAQAALMPVHMAAASAEMTSHALQTGVDLNTEALKIGSKLTGIGVSAQTKAAAAGVKASAKAAEEMAHLTTGFTSGFANALTR